MDEGFLEEQIRRLREMSTWISEAQSRRLELRQMLERDLARRHGTPLDEVRDLTLYTSQRGTLASDGIRFAPARSPRAR